MEDSKAAVTSAHSDFPSLLSALPPRRRSPTPASYRDSCLSLINAWHLVQRERGDMGGRGGGVWGGGVVFRVGAAHRSRRREAKKKKKGPDPRNGRFLAAVTAAEEGGVGVRR